MTRAQSAERDQAIAKLREWIKPGDTVYTILDHVSRSGMVRAIRVVVLKCESEPCRECDGKGQQETGIGMFPCATCHGTGQSKPVSRDLHPNYAIGKALGLRHWKRNGREQDALIMSGCGMDMGFHLVYNLSRVLFADGFPCTGKGCPSNDHSNGDRDYTPGRMHSDPGYGLKHRWL